MTFGLRSRDDVTMHGVCDNMTILEAWNVTINGFRCREMLVGGTAEVQVRDPWPCTLTLKSHGLRLPIKVKGIPVLNLQNSSPPTKKFPRIPVTKMECISHICDVVCDNKIVQGYSNHKKKSRVGESIRLAKLSQEILRRVEA